MILSFTFDFRILSGDFRIPPVEDLCRYSGVRRKVSPAKDGEGAPHTLLLRACGSDGPGCATVMSLHVSLQKYG